MALTPDVLYSTGGASLPFLIALTASDDQNRFWVLSLNKCTHVADAVSPHFTFTRGRRHLPYVIFSLPPPFFSLLWNHVRGLDTSQSSSLLSFLIGTYHRTQHLLVRRSFQKPFIPRDGGRNSPFIRSPSGNNPHLFHSRLFLPEVQGYCVRSMAHRLQPPSALGINDESAEQFTGMNLSDPFASSVQFNGHTLSGVKP